MINFVDFANKYHASFGCKPFKQGEDGVAEEWKKFVVKLTENDDKHMWKIAKRISRSTKPGILDFEIAVKEVREGDIINPARCKKITQKDCWACSDGMMEVPIAIGIKHTKDDDNGMTVKKIGLKFNDPNIKTKRVDTCRIFCSCTRGDIERKLHGNFYPNDDEFNKQAYDYIYQLRKHLDGRLTQAQKEKFDAKEIEKRRRHATYLFEYFNYAIHKINTNKK